MDQILSSIFITVFGVLLGAALAAWAVVLVVKNEVKSFVQSRERQEKASAAIRELAQVELELRRRDLEAGGGRQNDANALSDERVAAQLGAFQKAPSDPGRPSKAIFGPYSRRRCGFCEKVRKRILEFLPSQKRRDVAATTKLPEGAPAVFRSGRPWLSAK